MAPSMSTSNAREGFIVPKADYNKVADELKSVEATRMALPLNVHSQFICTVKQSVFREMIN